jgi:hypothetical protein
MKNKIFILILTITLLLTFGCGQKSQLAAGGFAMNAAYETAAQRAVMYDSDEMYEMQLAEEDGGSIGANFENVERKLVKRANIRIRTENLEAADTSISELLKKYNAYAASSSIEENSRFYNLRVPSQYYDIFLSEMNGIGRLLGRYESTEDVTLRYYDLEGRLATKKELLKTFQDYLGRARNIEEILAVEARISDLQYDIEGTGIQLRNLANQVDYSIIDLSIQGPAELSSYQELTFGERIKKLFGSFGGFLSSTAVVITGAVIYGIPILLLLCLLYWLLLGKVGLLKKLFTKLK